MYLNKIYNEFEMVFPHMAAKGVSQSSIATATKKWEPQKPKAESSKASVSSSARESHSMEVSQLSTPTPLRPSVVVPANTGGPCFQCGKGHGKLPCAFDDHPDKNTENVPFVKSTIGRYYQKLNRSTLDYLKQFDPAAGTFKDTDATVRKRIKQKLNE
jgi:hypothetical protein